MTASTEQHIRVPRRLQHRDDVDGDPVTFDEYVAARSLALTRFAYLLTHDRHHAEDLVQSALLKAYRNWGRVMSAGHPDAYVRRIVVTTHVSWARRLRRPERPMAEVPDEPAEGTSSDPAECVSTRDTVRRGLAELPARHRTVLVLRHYAGYDDAAIADLLGCAEVTVRVYASKGAARLRAVLDEHHADLTVEGKHR